MTLYGPPLLFALLIWWFSTGAIFFLDSRPRWTFPWSFAAVSAVAAAAVLGIARTNPSGAAIDAYADFSYGLMLWAWLETGFYMGFFMGPRRTAPDQPATGWRRLREAIETTLYHELAAGGLAILIAASCWALPNKLALWTFVLLWSMQLSAKLNVFLGVRNLAEDVLPSHLAFLRHYMTRKPMNPAFPVAVTGATAVAIMLAAGAANAATDYAAVAFAMLATLTVLAVVEHCMLVLPLRFEALWQWALPTPAVARLGSDEARPHAPPLCDQDFPAVPTSLNRVAH